MKKFKTLAVIGLLALAPVHSTELSAASNATVRVARDSSGKVDYKNFYQNGSRVKYENWNNGKKTVVINYKNRKVTSKTYYTNGVKTKYEKWTAGKVVQRTTYKYGKVASKFFYEDGKRIKYEKWNNGVKEITVKYYANGSRCKSYLSSNGNVKKFQLISSKNKIIYTENYEYKNGKKVKTTQYRNGNINSKQYYYKDGSMKHEDYNTKNGKTYLTQTILFDKNDNIVYVK